MITHQGDKAGKGHYVVDLHARDDDNDYTRWQRCSDTWIHEWKGHEHDDELRNDSYMMFYVQR